MIAGGLLGSASNEMTEVVEFTKTNSTPFYGRLPFAQYGAVGTMFGNTPILCGGRDAYSFDTCISYDQNSEWIQSNSMVEARVEAAAVKVNSTTFWILGGYDHGGDDSSYLGSTEFIIQDQINGVPGPILPYGLCSMCAIKISKNEIFVMGGWDGPSLRNEVWIYDPQNGFNQTQGPSLNSHRSAHSCSIMNDGEMTFIIVAGGYNGVYLNSVEIYDPTNNTWTYGK